MEPLPNVYARELSAEEIAAGVHREFIGGLWDTLGKLQFDFLVDQGLRPEMKLLDLGCGCLRGGLYFIPYLDPGNYFGIEANESLFAACEIELARAGLSDRMPLGNLLLNRDFEAWRLGAEFDFVLAQSVFSHLPDAWLRRCLSELARSVPFGGRFYATYFECPADWPREQPRTSASHGGTTFPDRDPYHYRVSDLQAATKNLPWKLEYAGPWGHPRAQHMALFVRQ
jgi:cyclopropane fatty-acyl-phospholipid synthase-like methyltransferase